MQTSQKISANIKHLSKEQKKPIKIMLQECGVNRNFIYDLERRCSYPSVEVIYKIADYLDCSVDYLLGRTDKPEVNK